MLETKFDIELIEADDSVMNESHKALHFLDYSLEESFLLFCKGGIALSRSVVFHVLHVVLKEL